MLIFSNWVQSLRTLYYHINKTFGGVVAYTGTMPMSEREESIRKFMEDDNVTIMMGTIQAMGVSHTLTAATNVIFYDEPWVPNAREQAIDRCHRLGTTSSIQIYTLIAQDTIDERIHDILYKRGKMTEFMFDETANIGKNTALLRELLNIQS